MQPCLHPNCQRPEWFGKAVVRIWRCEAVAVCPPEPKLRFHDSGESSLPGGNLLAIGLIVPPGFVKLPVSWRR
jgi:hypothetical protein